MGIKFTFYREFKFFVIGRILNRFSKDMGAVDEILIPFLLEATAVSKN